MMGPDYVWWHGIYEVAQHFYFKFIPAVRELGDAEANAYVDKLLQEPFHKWLSEDKATTAEKLRSSRMAQIYAELYQPPWISSPYVEPSK